MKSLKVQMGNVTINLQFDAWEIFKLAANQGDVVLAKLAIGHFDKSSVVVRDFFAIQSTTLFDDVPPRYVFALLRCFAHPTLVRCTHEGSSLKAIVFQSATQAAADFSLD